MGRMVKFRYNFLQGKVKNNYFWFYFLKIYSKPKFNFVDAGAKMVKK